MNFVNVIMFPIIVKDLSSIRTLLKVWETFLFFAVGGMDGLGIARGYGNVNADYNHRYTANIRVGS